jgi:hypothetical protein
MFLTRDDRRLHGEFTVRQIAPDVWEVTPRSAEAD